jgi:LysR family cyn operon transcriptional activator
MIKEFSGDFLQWLRGFYFIAKTGSVSAASKRMSRTQSTLTYQLQCLERELNVVLFDRVNNKLVITQEGKILLEKAISAFEIVSSMCAELSAAEGELKGFLRVDCVRPIALHILSGAIVEFCQENPYVKLQVSALQPSQIVSNVENATIDFGLVGLKSPAVNSYMDELFISKAVLVAPREHAYPLSRAPKPAELAGLPLLVMVQDYIDLASGPGYTLQQLEFLNMRIVVQVSLPQLILKLVAQGLGFAVMDEFSLWANASDNLDFSVYPLDDYLPTITYGFLIRKHKYLSPQARRLISIVKDRTTEITRPFEKTQTGIPIFKCQNGGQPAGHGIP